MFSSLKLEWLWRWLAALFVVTLPWTAWGQPPPSSDVPLPTTAQPPGEPPPPAAAAPSADAPPDDTVLLACFESFSNAQRSRRDGKLLDTRQALLGCASERCPAAIVQKCIGWLGEVAGEQPSVVVWAQDRAGRDTTDVRVWIDGRKIADSLDGRPLDLDPGSHLLLLEHQGEQKSVQLVLATGEKNRRVGISFAVAPPPPPTPTPAPIPPPQERGYHMSPLVWAGLAVAVAGGVVAGVTGGMALSRANELRDRCPERTCTESDERADYDQGARLAHTSTAFFVVAGAGVALGVVGILLSGPEDSSELRAGLGMGGAWLKGSF